MNNSTFKILFVVRKRNASKDGTVIISIRITIEGKSTEFSSKIKIPPSLWDAKNGRVKGKSRIAMDANTALDQIKSRLYVVYRDLENKFGYATPQSLKNAFLGVVEKKMTLLFLMTRKIEQKTSLVGNTIKEAAIVKYKETNKKLQQFIPIFNKTTDISIKEVNYDFITNFDIYLRSKCNLHHNTVVKHLRHLKQITTEAMKSGLIQIDPFMNITLSSKKGYRKFLTKEELGKIMNLDLVSDVLKEARDIFVFQCFTGFAYIDLTKLTVDDIIEGEDNRQFIIKNRTKTEVESFVPLFAIPLKIIKKYREKKLPDKKLLPVRSCQVLNRYLKEIAGLCGIQKKLSSHCGRHTFATLMLTEGISIESVSKMLGHTDIKTTQIYAQILNQKVVSEAEQKRSDIDLLSKLWVE